MHEFVFVLLLEIFLPFGFGHVSPYLYTVSFI